MPLDLEEYLAKEVDVVPPTIRDDFGLSRTRAKRHYPNRGLSNMFALSKISKK